MAAKTAPGAMPEIITSPILGGLFASYARWAAEVAEKAIRDSGQPVDLVSDRLHLLQATALQVEAHHAGGA